MKPTPDSKPIIMIVLDVFQIEGRGTVVTGLVRPESELAKRGTAIELHRPDGTCIPTTIAEIERFLRGTFSSEPPKSMGILLASTIPSGDLPAGTEVRYVGPAQAA